MLNFKVHYLPPYEREVWHYKEADTDLIQQSFKIFDWDKALWYGWHLHKNNQTITNDDKDPPWFNTKIKSLLQKKNKIHKKV